MDVRAGPWRRLSAKELMLLNCRYWRRLLRVPCTARRSNQSILKETNPECSLEGLDAEAEAPILWTPATKSLLIGKDPDAGKDWGQEEKGTTEAEMVGWHHRLNGHEFVQAQGDSEGHRSLTCCSPWGHEASDTTWWLSNNNGWCTILYKLEVYSAVIHSF